ncbi:MAG: hypothetical protein AAFP81_14930 [Pseudomonadota bacterium]
MKRLTVLLSSTLCLAACASVADMGDDAIRHVSFNRIQATPFKTALDTQSCNESVVEMFGFTKRSLEVRHGVQIEQVYHCEGQTIRSKVTLKNRTSEAMICAPMGDSIGLDTWVAPSGVSFYEYVFQSSTGFDCVPAEQVFAAG